VSCDCTGHQRRSIDAELCEFTDRVDVDQYGRPREPEAHCGNQTLSAGEHTGVAPVLLQKRECFIRAVRAKVIEGGGKHWRTSLLNDVRERGRHTAWRSSVRTDVDSTICRWRGLG